ncbi:proton-conducting transporter membrane subunit [Conexibacter sp. DBS9H8]|uniref:proton-conducting transporter transmembrane domain-containing protein n=1 Tax=Conexibacter sp. DBS9H8 TaxID=2937801 RepID=UPI00200FC953|nr:proton-conducting transporter membrane subunit [Conexibacter sp. DBS9H8]
MTEGLVIAVPALPVACGLLIQFARTPRGADRIHLLGALVTATAASLLAIVAFTHSADPIRGTWYVLDGASGAFLAVVAVIGVLSALVSPGYLTGTQHSLFASSRARTWYYLGFHLFWAALLAVPLVDNLAVAWLLVEATTGASALLVAYSGRRSALEAGWKYLVLTTFGLTVALTGIFVLYVGLAPHGGVLGTLDWQSIARHRSSLSRHAALLAFLLIIGGLATKIGWAPVHNWLPDAHSESPPPISAMLSGALLPTVILVAWRVLVTLGPALHPGVGDAILMGFGLASLSIAVPFLWRPLPWKRLLAYSSLEHMGVLALGIGFANPLATAGVVLHLAGHALAKALGFYAAIPLLQHQAEAGEHPPRGIARLSTGTATAIGVSLGALSGLPPSPLFFSELLILAGGIAGGHLVVAVLAAALLALGFLGLAHALIEGLLGGEQHHRWQRGRSVRAVERLAWAMGFGLLALSACAYLLPGSPAVRMLMGGLT